jgi:hypothetical protein
MASYAAYAWLAILTNVLASQLTLLKANQASQNSDSLPMCHVMVAVS